MWLYHIRYNICGYTIFVIAYVVIRRRYVSNKALDPDPMTVMSLYSAVVLLIYCLQFLSAAVELNEYATQQVSTCLYTCLCKHACTPACVYIVAS